MSSTLITVGAFGVAAAAGFFLGRFFPYDNVLRDLQNDAAHAVLDLMVRGHWFCRDVVSSRIFLERRRSSERMIVATHLAGNVGPHDVVGVELASRTPYEDLIMGRRSVQEIFTVRVFEKKKPQDGPALRAVV